MKVSELLKKSMVLIGAVSSGESLTADEQADGLSSLNDLLESWSTEGLTLPQSVREEFNLVAGQAEYTVGPTGNFATTIPTIIHSAAIIDTNSTPPLEIPIDIYNVQEYAMIQQKAQQSPIPQAMFYQYGSPLAKITLYFVPSENKKLALYSKKPFAPYASANDEMNLPVGYSRALRYALAMELAVEYGKQPSELVMMKAQELKAQLMRVNAQPIYVKSDALMTGGRFGYSILEDN